MIASDGIVPFRLMEGRYPTNEEGIEALVRGKFLRSFGGRDPSRDPWGRAYLYEYPGRIHPDSFDVCTYGADGRPGGEGEAADICNE